LQHSNAAVVLATTKVFLHYTRHNPKVHQSVYARLKAPLMTLMTTSSELSYTVLGHVALLVARSPGTFNDEYKAFFCRYVCVRGGLCVGDGRGWWMVMMMMVLVMLWYGVIMYQFMFMHGWMDEME
jgi:hypothetical protein